MNFEFGGNDHGVSGDEEERPEVVKSEKCGEVCHDCQHKNDNGCWHGESDGSHGSMVVNVQANSEYTSFAQEVFVGCYTSSGEYSVKIMKMQNSKISVFRNNDLVQEITKSEDGKQDWSYKTQIQGRRRVQGRRRIVVPVSIPQGTKARIRTVLVPINPGNPSSAEAKVEAKQADAGLDRCMTTNLCMAKLGTGSDAAFELRNDNGMQYKCLASEVLPSRLQDTCSVWVGCMPQESVNILKLLLEVTGALGSASLTDKGNFTASADPNECVDPAVEDAESWDCECFQEMKESCEGEEDEGACFKQIMCNNAGVCASWKAEQCTDLIQKTTDVNSVAQGGDWNAALGQRSQEQASIGIGDALDGSLQGKCSQ